MYCVTVVRTAALLSPVSVLTSTSPGAGEVHVDAQVGEKFLLVAVYLRSHQHTKQFWEIFTFALDTHARPVKVTHFTARPPGETPGYWGEVPVLHFVS